VPDLPGHAVKMLAILSRQTLAADEQIREINRDLLVLQKSDEMARRLATIPGVGPIGATAFAAAVTDPGQFRSGRQFAAWLGLTPLQNSSGGKERLGRISKMGDKYLRRLLVIGATALVRQFRNRPDKATPHFCVAAGEKAGAGRDRRHGQQDGADRLGADDARRNISRSTYPDTGCVGDNRFSRATLAA
jgi:transposase